MRPVQKAASQQNEEGRVSPLHERSPVTQADACHKRAFSRMARQWRHDSSSSVAQPALALPIAFYNDLNTLKLIETVYFPVPAVDSFVVSRALDETADL